MWDQIQNQSLAEEEWKALFQKVPGIRAFLRGQAPCKQNVTLFKKWPWVESPGSLASPALAKTVTGFAKRRLDPRQQILYKTRLFHHSIWQGGEENKFHSCLRTEKRSALKAERVSFFVVQTGGNHTTNIFPKFIKGMEEGGGMKGTERNRKMYISFLTTAFLKSRICLRRQLIWHRFLKAESICNMKSAQEKIILYLEKKMLRLTSCIFLVTTVTIYSLLMPVKHQLFIPRTGVSYGLGSTSSFWERGRQEQDLFNAGYTICIQYAK